MALDTASSPVGTETQQRMARPFDWTEFSRRWEEMSARLRNARSIVSTARAASMNPEELLAGEGELANALVAAWGELDMAIGDAQQLWKVCGGK